MVVSWTEILLLISLGFLLLVDIVLLFLWIRRLMYNIPVGVMRFTGNKERPTLILTRARKMLRSGVPMLYVQGYKDPIRDFLSQNYYPTPRGKWGGLLVWEFEDGMLTPVIPHKSLKSLDPHKRKLYEIALRTIQEEQIIKFDFDTILHKKLRLHAVDDVDVEFSLQERARVDGQYTGGLRDFLNKYGGHIALAIVVFCILIGFIYGISELPNIMSTCADAARTSALEAAKGLVSGGPAA